MELKIKDGDYMSDGAGGLVRVNGREELLMRVLYKLSVRRGSFALIPELGSRLHLLWREKPESRAAAAKQYIGEELHCYLGILLVSTVSITLGITKMYSGVREALRARFPRAKNTAQTRGAVQSLVVEVLERKLAAEVITGYDAVEVRALADEPGLTLEDVTVREGKDVLEVELALRSGRENAALRVTIGGE